MGRATSEFLRHCEDSQFAIAHSMLTSWELFLPIQQSCPRKRGLPGLVVTREELVFLKSTLNDYHQHGAGADLETGQLPSMLDCKMIFQPTGPHHPVIFVNLTIASIVVIIKGYTRLIATSVHQAPRPCRAKASHRRFRGPGICLIVPDS